MVGVNLLILHNPKPFRRGIGEIMLILVKLWLDRRLCGGPFHTKIDNYLFDSPIDNTSVSGNWKLRVSGDQPGDNRCQIQFFHHAIDYEPCVVVTRCNISSSDKNIFENNFKITSYFLTSYITIELCWVIFALKVISRFRMFENGSSHLATRFIGP